MSNKRPQFLKPDDSDDLFAADREGETTEQTDFIFNKNKSLSLIAQRNLLPIKKHRNEILYCLEKFQTLIICGETGSGV